MIITGIHTKKVGCASNPDYLDVGDGFVVAVLRHDRNSFDDCCRSNEGVQEWHTPSTSPWLPSFKLRSPGDRAFADAIGGGGVGRGPGPRGRLVGPRCAAPLPRPSPPPRPPPPAAPSPLAP